jgi:hypothetical protein
MRLIGIGGAVVAAVVGSASARGPEWVEQGDAGSVPQNSQTIAASGPVLKVRGTLQGASELAGVPSDFEDMYRILITQPTQFHFRTDPASGGGADFNTLLWVFDETGQGLLGNDDANNPGVGSAIFQFSNDGTETGIFQPGIYLVCVTGTGNVPLSQGLQMFLFETATEVSGPDGPGGQGVVDAWSNSFDGGGVGDYELSFEGVTGVPGPGVLAIMAMMVAMRSSRRRR